MPVTTGLNVELTVSAGAVTVELVDEVEVATRVLVVDVTVVRLVDVVVADRTVKSTQLLGVVIPCALYWPADRGRRWDWGSGMVT